MSAEGVKIVVDVLRDLQDAGLRLGAAPQDRQDRVLAQLLKQATAGVKDDVCAALDDEPSLVAAG